jgi:hypothetical protein
MAASLTVTACVVAREDRSEESPATLSLDPRDCGGDLRDLVKCFASRRVEGLCMRSRRVEQWVRAARMFSSSRAYEDRTEHVSVRRLDVVSYTRGRL